jgi:hypothetical protein
MQLLSRVCRRHQQKRSSAFCPFLAVCFLFAPAYGIAIQVKTADSDTRSIGEYRADLKTFMKLSKEDDPQLERNAVFNLCQLHYEIVTDSRFATSQQLQGIRAVIAKRLQTFSKDEKKSKLREQREAKKSKNQSLVSDPTSPADSSQTDSTDSDVKPDSDSSESGEDDASQGSTGSVSDSGTNDAMYDSASESHFTLGALSGGPSQLFGYAGGQFGPPWDHGEELVDLITTVINPSFWRRNGGPGSIQYYQPSLVLVIRASQQGNEEVGDLLQRLRANGGTQLNIGGFGGAIGN